MHSHAGAWERETSRPNSCNINPPGPVDPPSGAAAGCALAAPSPPQGGRDLFLLVPMLPRGNKKRSAYVCIPTQERGNKSKTVSVCMHSHAGAWERENGQRNKRSGQRNVCIPTQERGPSPPQREKQEAVSVMYAFPRRSVGTRNEHAKLLQHQSPCPVDPPLWRCCGLRPCRAFSPSRGERFISPCSHAPAWEQEAVSVCMHSHAGAWEQENGQRMYAFPRRSVGTREQEAVSVMYAFPRRSVGTRKTRGGQRNVCIPTQERGNEKRACQTPATSIPLALLIPPLALLRAAPLPRLLPLKGGEIYFSLFPCSRVGTRSGQRNVCIPTQERGNEKRAGQTPATLITVLFCSKAAQIDHGI